ncbi:MAG TPA: Gldg family protein [Opitutales bacterium]|nr:Gldg family protein [Opitutales bacterium]
MFARLDEFRFARWVKSLNRTTQILLILILVGALNYAAARHFRRWDLTADRHLSLSAESLVYLDQKVRSAPTPVEIINIPADDKDNQDIHFNNQQISALLDEYANAARDKHIPNLKVSVLDPLRDSSRYAELKKIGLTDYTRIFVVCGPRARSLNLTDLYDTKSGDNGTGPQATDFKGENAISSAILDVVQTAPDTVYYSKGNGELDFADPNPSFGLSNFGQLLLQRGYAIKPIDLSDANKIPDDAKLVVIVNPIRPLDANSAIVKLRNYLTQRNGHLLIFLQPTDNPGLDPLLHDWGLHSADLVIFEDSNHRPSNNVDDLIVDPAEPGHGEPHDIIRLLALTGTNLHFGSTRPVEVDPTSTDDQKKQVTELLFTSKSALLIKNFTDNKTTLNPVTDSKGAVAIAALSMQHPATEADLPGGEMIVIGNANVATNYLFNKDGNSDFLLECVNFLSNRTNMLGIPPKMAQQAKISMTSDKDAGLLLRLALLPAAVALFGLGVFWVRNRT